MTHHCCDTREITSSQNIKAMPDDGSHLLAKIDATTKIKSQLCLWMLIAEEMQGTRFGQFFSAHTQISSTHIQWHNRKHTHTYASLTEPKLPDGAAVIQVNFLLFFKKSPSLRSCLRVRRVEKEKSQVWTDSCPITSFDYWLGVSAHFTALAVLKNRLGDGLQENK